MAALMSGWLKEMPLRATADHASHVRYRDLNLHGNDSSGWAGGEFSGSIAIAVE